MQRRDVLRAIAGVVPVLASDASSDDRRWHEVSVAGMASGDVKRAILPDGRVVHILRRPPGHPEYNESSPEWLVVLAICTHQACEPKAGIGPGGGWRCLCHGSEFDPSGRVTRGPAKRDLNRLNYLLDDDRLLIDLSTSPGSTSTT